MLDGPLLAALDSENSKFVKVCPPICLMFLSILRLHHIAYSFAELLHLFPNPETDARHAGEAHKLPDQLRE